MIAPRVPSEEAVFKELRALGFEPTNNKTDTGEFWKHSSGRHIQVPFSVQGYYPDWLVVQFWDHAVRISQSYEEG